MTNSGGAQLVSYGIAPTGNEESSSKVIAALWRVLEGQIARNALSLYAVQGLNFAMPLVVLPYLLRVLSPDGYGSIAFAQSLMGYAIILTDFGFNLTAARDISVVRHDPQEAAKVYWTTMAAKACLLLLSMVVISSTVLAVPAFRKEWEVFAVCGILVVGSAVFPTWYFQGNERLKEMAIVQAISKCVIFGSVFVFVRSPADKLIAALLMSAPQLVGMAVALICRMPCAPSVFYKPSPANVRAALKGSADMFFATASTSLYLHTNTFVLGLMAGERAVAFYSVGNRIISAVQSATSPITQAVFPRASVLFASRPAEAWRLVRRISWFVFPAIGFASMLMIAFAPAIVGILAGRNYDGAIPGIRIMAPVPVLVTAAGLLAQTVMVNLGLTKSLWRIYAAVGVLNLLILPILVHFFAATGAAMALTLSEAIGPVLMILTLRRRHAFTPVQHGGLETRHSSR
jgi:polysaccharide transporter, PST family